MWQSGVVNDNANFDGCRCGSGSAWHTRPVTMEARAPARPHGRRHTRFSATMGRVVLLAAAVSVATACSDDATESSVALFCEQARINTALIVAPPLSSESEFVATMEFYRLMGQLAPIGIADQWSRLVEAMETASEITPGDPSSEQRVAMTAYAVERSAYEVKMWLNQNCGVDLPITTIAPQDPVPAQTVPVTTVPGTGATTAPTTPP